jgi:hypothetical protein
MSRTVTDSRVVLLKPCYRGAMTTASEGSSERFADEADIDTIEMELSAAHVLALSRAAERATAAAQKYQSATRGEPTSGFGAGATPVASAVTTPKVGDGVAPAAADRAALAQQATPAEIHAALTAEGVPTAQASPTAVAVVSPTVSADAATPLVADPAPKATTARADRIGKWPLALATGVIGFLAGAFTLWATSDRPDDGQTSTAVTVAEASAPEPEAAASNVPASTQFDQEIPAPAAPPPATPPRAAAVDTAAGNAPANYVPAADAPVRVRNPFDASEVFEFPPGTSKADARKSVADVLMQRALDRKAR